MRPLELGGILPLMETREVLPVIYSCGRVEVHEVDTSASELVITRALPPTKPDAPVVDQAHTFRPFFVTDPSRSLQQRALIEDGADQQRSAHLVIAWSTGYRTASQFGKGSTA